MAVVCFHQTVRLSSIALMGVVCFSSDCQTVQYCSDGCCVFHQTVRLSSIALMAVVCFIRLCSIALMAVVCFSSDCPALL